MLSKKTYLTIFIVLLLANTLMAQLDFRLTAAYGNMYLKPTTGLNITADPDDFLTVGFQADYYISNRIALGIGADYYVLDSQFDVILKDYSHKYKGIDNWEGDPVPREYEFTIRSNAEDIIEQNTIAVFDIPVSVIYSYPLGNNIYLATRLGVKAGIPLNNKFILTESDLFTRLYFEEWDLELFNIPAHGLYDSRTDWHPEGELNLNPAFSVFTEVGIDFPVFLLKVRVSGYFSYGLNNIIDEKQSSLIYWREDYNNILSLAESVRPMQIGVKVGVGLISKREKHTVYKKQNFKYKRSRTKCGGTWMN